ncbi:MAG TPA: CDP-alcohol phosphatidyltransferase family protein [Syntrophales bacterium]|nr:CDP-alcohol phosphatidyltransferase family protein [Syntrophales bacterium]
MNIPNFLTLLRILLVPVTVIFLMQGAFTKALIVLVVSGITDALDGFLARILNQQTVLGAYLDPIADKALLASCFVTLSIKGIIPGWFTVIVISRDLIILIGIAIMSIMSIPYKISPSFISKITTTLQLLVLAFFMIFRIWPGLINYMWLLIIQWLTVLFTVVSGLDYMLRGIRLNTNSL